MPNLLIVDYGVGLPEASMMPQLGQQHDCLKSMKIFFEEGEWVWETWHILFRNGVKLLIKSMYFVCESCWSLTV